MSSTSEHLPFFVYGTLRPGERNYFLLRGRTLQEIPTSVPNLLLYSLGSFPMAVFPGVGLPFPRIPVKGTLITLAPEHYDKVLERLDALEEFDPEHIETSMYWRLRYLVPVDGTEKWAWLYVGNPVYLSKTAPLIESGDWVQYRQQFEERE